MKKIIAIQILLLSLITAGIYAQDFERFKDDAGVEDFNITNFETNLNYVRGVMTERSNQQQAIVAKQFNKLDKTLHGFLQTDFMLKFRELKIEAEALASTFKAQANRIKPQEVARVKRAYIKIADEFNRQLVEIKGIFWIVKR